MRDAIRRDLHDSWRRMRRSPGASFVVVVSLGVAMAASATVFSFVNVLMLRTLLVPNPQRLVSVDSIDPKTTQPTGFYGDAFAVFQASQTSFAALSLHAPSLYRVSARGVTLDVAADGVTSGYRDVVGLRMIAGRFMSGGEEPVRPGDLPHEAVISERLWARMFGSDPQALGERITVDGIEVAIAGVAAANPDGLDPESLTDLYLPINVARVVAGDASPQVRARNLVGRLADGVKLEQARAEVLGRWPGIQASTMTTLPASAQRTLQSPKLAVESLARGFSSLRRQYGQALVVLTGLTLLLLAVACVNVAGLASAQAAARQHEFAVRLALGAGKRGIVRTLLVDGVVLSLCSAVAALPLVWWATSWLTAAVSVARAFPLAQPMTPDAWVLAVIVAVSIVVGVLCGSLPALRAVEGRAADVSRGGRTSTRGVMASARVALATQVALSLVLLVGASLFVGSLAGLRSNHATLGTSPILWTRLAQNPAHRGMPGTKDYYQALTNDLASLPGVDSAVLSSFFPAYLGYVGSLPVDRYTSADRAGDTPSTASGLTEFVSPGFFDTFGIARLRGRDFTWADDESTPKVAVVSASLAGQLFPGGNAIGQFMRIEAANRDRRGCRRRAHRQRPRPTPGGRVPPHGARPDACPVPLGACACPRRHVGCARRLRARGGVERAPLRARPVHVPGVDRQRAAARAPDCRAVSGGGRAGGGTGMPGSLRNAGLLSGYAPARDWRTCGAGRHPRQNRGRGGARRPPRGCARRADGHPGGARSDAARAVAAVWRRTRRPEGNCLGQCGVPADGSPGGRCAVDAGVARGDGGSAATRVGCKMSPARCVPPSRRCSRRHRPRLSTRVAVLLSG
jgi:putative ABC transport system permease protein